MHELEQLIWYFGDKGQVCSAKVLARMIVENAHEDWAFTEKQKEIFTPFGKGGIFYATCHGIIPNEKAFGSKQDLVDSL